MTQVSNAGIVEIFRNHSFSVDSDTSRTELAAILTESSEDELWPVFDDLKVEGTIGFSANGRVRKTTLAYALMYAFENGVTTIDQSIVDQALDKANVLCNSLFGAENANREASVQRNESVETDSENSTVPGRTRTKNFYPFILKLVQDNNQISKDEVVSAAIAKYPDKSENTVVQYYHKARKEIGLKPSGKRGRQKTDTFDRVFGIVKDMMEANPEVAVKNMIQAVAEAYPDIKESSRQVYTYKARKQILEG